MNAIVAFSAVDWNGLWQRPHSLMSRLSQQWPVVFVNNIGIRQVGWSDVPHMISKAAQAFPLRNRGETRYEAVPPPGMSVLPLMAIPIHGMNWAAHVNEQWVGRQIKAHLKNRGLTPGVLWVNLPTPAAVRIAERFNGPVIYDYSDEFTAFPGVPPQVVVAESNLFRRADLVITSAYSLADRCRDRCQRVVVVPNGVNPVFLETGAKRHQILEDGEVHVGYVGAMHEWFDHETLRTAAISRPTWRFHLVGPATPKVRAALEQCSNIHFEGKVPAERVPNYLEQFDVGLIPFFVNQLTRGVNPLKLYEYCAAGLPVVSAALPEVLRHQSMVHIYRSSDELVTCVERALAEDTPHSRAIRLEFAARFSWDSLSREVATLLRPWMERTV